MPFGDECLVRNHSEDGAKLNMRWMRGVFVGKVDRTDEFLLLTPTGAMKTRCGARSRDPQSNTRMSWRVANVRKDCTCDRTFWLSTDVLQDAQVVLDLDNIQMSAEQELNKKWWTKVMQLNSRHLETRKKLCKSLMPV